MGEIQAGLDSNVILLTGITLFICVILHLIYKIVFGKKKEEALKNEVENEEVDLSEKSSQTAVSDVRGSGKRKKQAPWKGKTEFTHPWLLKNFKGHPGTVLLMDFSANGKFMAATCDDGSVMLWDVRDLNQKEHKTLRVNIEFDHASHVAWSPDSKAFIVHTVRENNIVVYKIEKKKDGTIGSAAPVITFDKVHQDDVVGFDISSNGRFMMSCSSKTDMVIWDLKGQQLTRMDTYLMSTFAAKISPCGRFVVATGFTPDVKVMEVCFTKTGEFKQVAKAFELSGHSSGIYDVAFDVDTSHIATISKDGTWKLFHTKIEYTRGESPHVLETGTYTQTANAPHIALSPNAEVLAVSVENSVEFYDTYTGKLYDTVENLYSGLINFMKFDASGKYLFVCGDKAIRVLHNVHQDDVVGFDISSNGRFMMSCSSKTDMVIWDLKGQQLTRMDTYLMSTFAAKISPCGRFVVATGFTPDVKVMEVCFTKTGEFKQVAKAFELSGHSSGIYDVAFDVDTSHIATISKDGTWKLFHTKIEYTRGESPHVLETGTYTQTANAPHIALSPNAEVLAVSVENSVEFYDTYTGKLYDTVENLYSGLINFMKFDASGKYLFVCGDKAIRVLHNVCGYYTTIASCTRLLSTKQTSATQERLNKTIQECKETLAKFGK